MSSATKFGDYFKLPNPGLRAYFNNVVLGSDEVISTPFGKHAGESQTSASNLLQEWADILEPIKREWPSLWEFENDLRKKVGPMSVRKPLKERMSDIDSYYEGILLPSEPIDPRAIDAAQSSWKAARGLRIRSQSRTVDNMKKSTSSGSPFFTKKRRVTDATVPCQVREDGKYTLQTLKGTSWEACAILGWRGQEGGPSESDVKQRVVWMFPYAVNIQELQVYQPMIEAFQRLNLFPAWVGMDAVDAQITKLFDTKGDRDFIVCTDFTAFDQHFNSSLQNAAFACIKYLFDGTSDINKWLDQVFPIKYQIPLAYDWDKIRFGLHGMGSGSGGTNADETLAHRCLQHEAAILNHRTLNPYSQCLGDDGILSYPKCDVDDVIEAYTSHGLEMNPDKQYVDKQSCQYLRRWHHAKYRPNGYCAGVYSTFRALGRLMYHERYYDPEIWNEKMVALRQLSIIENVKWHPLATRFADFCMTKDKFRLGLDLPGFLDDIERLSKEATDLMPDFMGYTKSLQNGERGITTGINEWWIVKYLKSKA